MSVKKQPTVIVGDRVRALPFTRHVFGYRQDYINQGGEFTVSRVEHAAARRSFVVGPQYPYSNGVWFGNFEVIG